MFSQDIKNLGAAMERLLELEGAAMNAETREALAAFHYRAEELAERAEEMEHSLTPVPGKPPMVVVVQITRQETRLFQNEN